MILSKKEFNSFIMLSARELVENRERSAPELPSFGVKDFEPDGSTEQLSQIQQCLSEIKELVSFPRIKTLGTLSQAVWRSELNLAEVTQQTGSYWVSMGHLLNHKLYIYPEEALYLLELGALQLTYNEVPLSIQRAYFILLQQNDTTIEKYRVYSQLNANGYKVVRHSSFNSITKYEKQIKIHKLGIKLKNFESEIKLGKRSQELEEGQKSSKRFKQSGETILPINYNENDNEREISKKMQAFEPFVDDSEGNLKFDFDIYTNSFKKSCLQLPKYRVIVHRSEDPMPDLTEIYRLAKKYKDDVPVIHAITFPNHVAFFEINPVILPDAFCC